ncbi:DNA-binding protein [Baileyella intestinalis]|uniref:DNA-binding protein n=1 Tax=Baileyella intestinalis TaxID=2606709 RepID=UPI0022DEBBD9|nr:DNA-binding protein [Baileyella intestinalis]
MESAMFVNAETVAKDFGVSRAKAYRLIKQMNEELENRGYITVAGRVSRQYYYERTYGLKMNERGAENASL